MLENGDCIDVSQSGPWDVDVDVSQSGDWEVMPAYVNLPGNKPYLINLSQVECIVGEWNKDRTQYGARIFYASGNSFWVSEDAAKALYEHMGEAGKDAKSLVDHLR